MLSRKLLKSIGRQFTGKPSVPPVLSCKVQEDDIPDDVSVSSVDTAATETPDAFETTEIDSSGSHESSSTSWMDVYDHGMMNQVEEQRTELTRELAIQQEIQQKKPTNTMERFRYNKATTKIQNLTRDLEQLDQIASFSQSCPNLTHPVHPTPQKKHKVFLEHEECVNCGMVGTIKIDVHRCTKHCTSCHRESKAQHFHETTGTTISTTNPGRYSRKEHFINTLKRIQAKKAVELPNMLVGKVLQYLFKKHRVRKPIDVKYQMMKKALKKTGFDDYTDHITAIFCQITGRDPPRFTIKQTDRLIKLFDKLQLVFDQACFLTGQSRANWLSYEFTIYKLCEKEGYAYMQNWFGVLKGPTTLRNQDKVMGKMFELNNWDFEETKPNPTPPQDVPQNSPRALGVPRAPKRRRDEVQTNQTPKTNKTPKNKPPEPPMIPNSSKTPKSLPNPPDPHNPPKIMDMYSFMQGVVP